MDYEIAKKGFTYALLAAGNEDESRFIPPMRGQFYDIVPFWSSTPTVRKVYVASIPMEKELQFQFYQGECASSMRYEDGRKKYSFAMDDMMPFAKEPNMVDLFDAAPKLMMSSTPQWKDKSLWFNKVNEDYGSFDPLPEAQKKVDELIKGKKTEMEKIAVLTHWVADNIRYSGISMGKGEGFTLHNTKMNYTDRCGVCKDIAGTLISFLRMAGFEAYPAMTMAGSRVESIPADHFNHCVAVVKLSNGTYMPLDPTWVPFCRELWSSAEQQQNYLRVYPKVLICVSLRFRLPKTIMYVSKPTTVWMQMVHYAVPLPLQPKDRVTAISVASLPPASRANGKARWNVSCWLSLPKPDC